VTTGSVPDYGEANRSFRNSSSTIVEDKAIGVTTNLLIKQTANITFQIFI